MQQEKFHQNPARKSRAFNPKFKVINCQVETTFDPTMLPGWGVLISPDIGHVFDRLNGRLNGQFLSIQTPPEKVRPYYLNVLSKCHKPPLTPSLMPFSSASVA
jgi:hypothetical protein